MHATNTFLIYCIGRRLFREWWVSVFAASLFAILPNRTESIVWISAVTHVLATFWYLLALLAYIFFLQKKLWRHYFLALLSILASLLTKEIGITFLGVWFFLDLTLGGEKPAFNCVEWETYLVAGLKRCAQAMVRLLIPITILVFYLFLRRHATGYVMGYYSNQQLTLRWDIVRFVFTELTATMILPWPYHHLLANFLWHRQWLWWIFHLSAIIVPVAVASRNRRRMIAFIVCYGISFLPFSQLFLHPLNNSGERYAYFTSIFFVFCVSQLLFSLTRFFRRPNHVFALGAGIMCVIFLPVSWHKQDAWSVSNTVIQSTLQDVERLAMNKNELIFIGLPDNVDGAEAWRNGIQSALALTHDWSERRGERVPQYVRLSIENAFADLFRMERVASSSYLLSTRLTGTRSFTGLPVVTTSAYVSTLLNGARNETGTAILLKVSTSTRVDVVYYNAAKLQLFSIPSYGKK